MKKILFILLLSISAAFSQSGMVFDEFREVIDKYFDEALINDVEKEMPVGSNYKIWGWDVGDYSGDGYFDLAFTLREYGLRNRIVKVFMFVDIEGYLVLVDILEKQFVEIPLEVGVVIKDNSCYLTEKIKKFNWNIEGYRFDNGSLSLVDEFETSKINKFTKETYTNYVELTKSEKYIVTSNGDIEFKADYLTIPSYPRSKLIYKGYEDEIFSFDVDYIKKGAYDWDGKEDAAFKVRSAYDDDFLYFIINVFDDKVVVPSCEECTADYIDLWIDMFDYYELESKFVKDVGYKLKMQEDLDTNLYKFSIYLGDYESERPKVNIETNLNLSANQKSASNLIKAISKKTNSGYIVKVKIPFDLIGIDIDKIQNGEINEYGCSVLVHDIDNEFRPEEETQIASSKFTDDSPASWGSLFILPPNKWYGRSKNIYRSKILKYIDEYGF
jgi:hypothetical protein